VSLYTELLNQSWDSDATDVGAGKCDVHHQSSMVSARLSCSAAPVIDITLHATRSTE